ncbi:MAG TPA: outer membrane protein [Xanthobacteraceae bacterium]
MRAILAAGAATVAVMGLTVTAHAADLPRPVPAPMVTKAAPYVAPGFNWTGLYVGVNGGGGWGHAFTDLSGGMGTSGGVAGGTIGYNAQFGAWVLGLEGDMDWSDVSGSRSTGGCPGCSVSNDWLSTARGRVGYAFGSWLPYVTGGLAAGDVKASAPGFPGATNTQIGWAAGAGVEYALSNQWSAKVEYLHVDLGNFDCGVSCGAAGTDNVTFHDNLVRGGINFRF